jgi:cyclopropane fatty-acyl-phospholipid synthase-like methyltransferase
MARRTRRNPKTAIGGGWDSTGEMQFERLLRYGMKPRHRLFDIGCGSLRGGRFFIEYLDNGNYTGNDISPDILDAARKHLKEWGFAEKKPRLFLTNDTTFSEVNGETFDYIHAQSVLSHMPPEDIESLFKNVKKIMRKDTQFFASFFLSRNNRIYPGNNRKNFSYPLEWMETTGRKHGLAVELVETDRKQKLMRITLT